MPEYGLCSTIFNTDCVQWFLNMDRVQLLKRDWGLISSLFWYTFWPKISKTSKSLKNDFYLIKSDQDQIFRAKIRPKGPDLGFGQITIVESQIFSTVQKSDFFWSDWAQNWSKRSSRLIILAKTLKLAKFWDFHALLAIFVVFDPVWQGPKKSAPQWWNSKKWAKS